MSKSPTLRDTLHVQRGLSEGALSSTVSDLRASKQAKTKRSKSPTYLRNTRTGERRIRRTCEEADDICEQKARRKSLIDSSLALEMNDSMTKNSCSDNTQTTATTAGDSFTSFSTGASGNESRSRSLSARRDRSIAATLVSPKSAKTCSSSSSKKKNLSGAGRRIKLARQGELPESLPIDGESCTLDSRGRKKEKKSKKKKKKHERSRSAGNDEDSKSVKSDKKKKRTSSLGPAKVVETSKSPRTRRTGRKRNDTKHSVNRAASHSTVSTLSSKESSVNGDDRAIMLIHWKSETRLKENDSDNNSSRSKFRSTVDENGKIRRIRADRKLDNEDDNRSEVSRSSRSSQRSRRSSRSSTSSKTSRSKCKQGKPLKGQGSLDDSFADDASTHSNSSLTWRDFHQRSKSRTSKQSSQVQKDASLAIDPMRTSDLQKEIDSLQEELLAVKEERSVGLEETARAKKELRERKRELQKIEIERGELRAAIHDQDQTMKQKDCQIAALEKAVESQLDKVDELEEEVQRAYAEIDHLEMRVADLSQIQDQSSSNKAPGEPIPAQPATLDKAQLGSKAELERTLQQNRMLQRALDKQTEDADSLSLAKDQEIESLKNQLRLLSQKRSCDEQFESNTEERVTPENSKEKPEYGIFKAAKAEAVKAEVQVMKSKWEGASRRNTILEEDIAHLQGMNRSFEDDLRNAKAEVAMLQARFDGAVSSEAKINVSTRIHEKSAADMCLRRLDDGAEDDLSASQGSISSLWSKFRKTNSVHSLNSSLHKSTHSAAT